MTISVLLTVAIVLLVGVAIFLRLKHFKGDAPLFWEKIGVPLATPIVVASLGIMYTALSDAQRISDRNGQKKAELLREMVATKDRPDVAFLTAVGDQLVLRLNRRDALLKDKSGQLTAAQKLERLSYEERAAYFFYGMFHVAIVDFYASKGYKLYPRLWMEEAFSGLSDQVTSLVYGGHDETSLAVPKFEEDALYNYFGAAAATFKNITESQGQPTKAALVFDFNLMLDHEIRRPDLPLDRYQLKVDQEIREGCARFQGRLNSSGPDRINVEELELTIAAIEALDDYAFNKLFAIWYQGSGDASPEEVRSLSSEIPAKIRREPPRDYLFYPLRGWKDKDIRAETWKLIYANVPVTFRRCGKGGPCALSRSRHLPQGKPASG